MDLEYILDNNFIHSTRVKTPLYTKQLQNVLKMRRVIRQVIEGQNLGIIHPEMADKVVTKLMTHYLETGEVIKLSRKGYI